MIHKLWTISYGLIKDFELLLIYMPKVEYHCMIEIRNRKPMVQLSLRVSSQAQFQSFTDPKILVFQTAVMLMTLVDNNSIFPNLGLSQSTHVSTICQNRNQNKITQNNRKSKIKKSVADFNFHSDYVIFNRQQLISLPFYDAKMPFRTEKSFPSL